MSKLIQLMDCFCRHQAQSAADVKEETGASANLSLFLLLWRAMLAGYGGFD
jgi:hypothetical protein